MQYLIQYFYFYISKGSEHFFQLWSLKGFVVTKKI